MLCVLPEFAVTYVLMHLQVVHKLCVLVQIMSFSD